MSALSAEYYPISTSSTQSSAGISAEAELLASTINNIFVDMKPSEQKWLFNELQELSISADRENWDNLGSSPLDHETYQIAKRFILSLPSSVPPPELTVDRDGEVAFDWIGKKGQLMSASLRKDGRLAFAYQISTRNRFSGVEDFNDSIPKGVIEGVKKIFTR